MKQNLLHAKRFIDFVEPELASSNCFSVQDSSGVQWVVRAKKRGKNAKRLFNEYIAGSLACEMKLSRPDVRLIDLRGVSSDLPAEMFDRDSLIGVASLYWHGLDKVLPPAPYDPSGADFPKINFLHLEKIFGRGYTFDQFYGQKVLSHWLMAQDDHKYENLHSFEDNGGQNRPVFLDLDMALNGMGWEDLPVDYNNLMPWVSQAPFLLGVLLDSDRFEPWLNRIEQMSVEFYEETVSAVPDAWQVPNEFIQRLQNLIIDQRSQFVEIYRSGIQVSEELW